MKKNVEWPKLLKAKFDVQLIAQATGLSIGEIEKLRD
jgi:hypothetical protein